MTALFKVNDTPIIADEVEVIVRLREQLALNGVDRFKNIRRLDNHLQVTCPFHKGGQETKPSCGITINDIKQGGKLVKAGTVHCFTCGYVSSLEEMISRLYGKDDMGVFGIEWLKKNFTTIAYEQRKDITGLQQGRETRARISDIKPKEKEPIKYVSEEELDSYRYTHPYAYKRRLTDDIIEQFDVGYDDHFILESPDKNDPSKVREFLYRCLTFPVRDETGGTLFIARRSVDKKFFHYPAGVDKPVYGVYELSQLENYPDTVIICESILNCLTCWAYGKYAVALNGTGTKQQLEQLKKMPTKHFVLGLDPDDAGNRGRQKIKNYLGKCKILTEYIIPKGKDINDLTKEQFDALEEVIC